MVVWFGDLVKSFGFRFGGLVTLVRAFLAELDTGDGPSLDDRLVGAAVGLEGLLHGVDEVLLLEVARAAGSARVSIIYLLQDLHKT